MTFIVRLSVAEDGALTGVVERPKTGEKERFQGSEALGVTIAQMARRAAQVTAVLLLIATGSATTAAAGPGTPQFSTATFTATAPRRRVARRPSPATVTPSFTPTFTSTATPSRTPTFTSTALPTSTRTATATFTSTSLPPTPTRTPTFTSTALPTSTRIPTATFTSTALPPTPTIPFGLSIGDVSILEGDSGTRSAVFVVRLRGSATYPVKVLAKTADGTATAGVDYDATLTPLLFNPFETQKTVSVAVRGDRGVEPSETFSVVLGGAVGAPLADPVGIGTILNDDGLGVGVPELVPPNPATAPDDPTTLILRWVHPDRWRALNTVDLRLLDGDQPVLWVRFDEAANTLAVCDADGTCGAGVAPGTGAPIAGDTATFYPAESAVRGSGPTGPSVDLIFTFSLARSLGGRILQVETAATEDSGEEQGFLPIASLEVIDTRFQRRQRRLRDPTGARPRQRRQGRPHPRVAGAGRIRDPVPPMTRVMMTRSGMRHRLALVGLGLAVSLLAPGAASAQFCLSQSECEDGLFCTDDICFLGVCVRTARNCGDLQLSVHRRQLQREREPLRAQRGGRPPVLGSEPLYRRRPVPAGWRVQRERSPPWPVKTNGDCAWHTSVSRLH